MKMSTWAVMRFSSFHEIVQHNWQEQAELSILAGGDCQMKIKQRNLKLGKFKRLSIEFN